MKRKSETGSEQFVESTGAPQLRVVEGAGERAEPLAAPEPGHRTGADIRTKILSLVVLSALLPAALVGIVSYFTARNIQNQEVSEQLTSRVEVIQGQMDRFLTARAADAEIFANSFVVSESLGVWQVASTHSDSNLAIEARERIHAYLTEVRGRYPLYRELAIYDATGALVAAAGPATNTTPLPAPSAEVETRLSRSGGKPHFYVTQRVRGGDDEWLGSLVTASAMDELWHDLANAQEQARGRIQVLDYTGAALFDSDLYPAFASAPTDSEGARLALTGDSGIADYSDDSGEPVVGAYLRHGEHQVGFLVEIARSEAFAVSYRLRDFALLSSLLAAGLIAGLGFWIVVGLTRPIGALISGARAASEGNLAIQIPVTSKDEIGLLTQVFNRMVRSLLESRSELQRLSSTDELTGLNNRRQLTKQFEVELERSRRTGRPLSVLMIDIDRFKSFNDEFGHLEGDAVLRRLGSFLRHHLRPTDVLARYGGEEFIVLLPETNNKQALNLAERLREGFVEEGRAAADPEVTFSVGVSTNSRECKSRDQLVAVADKALYSAKRDGRNRVHAAG